MIYLSVRCAIIFMQWLFWCLSWCSRLTTSNWLLHWNTSNWCHFWYYSIRKPFNSFWTICKAFKATFCSNTKNCFLFFNWRKSNGVLQTSSILVVLMFNQLCHACVTSETCLIFRFRTCKKINLIVFFGYGNCYTLKEVLRDVLLCSFYLKSRLRHMYFHYMLNADKYNFWVKMK